MEGDDDLYKVWEIKAQEKPGKQEAEKMLQRIANEVQPIMKKHKWRVKLLSEFAPPHDLFGTNKGAGEHVKLKLRQTFWDWNPYPFYKVVDAMLHELCHNAISPCNGTSCYQLLDELREEYAVLRVLGPGRRVGGDKSIMSARSLTQTAAMAAERRLQDDDLYKVWEIKAMEKPGKQEAEKMLWRIPNQVEPIMKKHKWRVKLLSEFTSPHLMGTNMGAGEHVKLKLRYDRTVWDWDPYPFDLVLDVMLHELCHNAIKHHNASFFQLLDELREECEELIGMGISGPGRRIGGDEGIMSSQSPTQAAAMAAERRLERVEEDDLSEFQGTSTKIKSSTTVTRKRSIEKGALSCTKGKQVRQVMS